MRLPRAAFLAVLLVASLIVGATPAAAQPDSEETRLEMQIETDGDARWSVVARFSLEDDRDREDFEAFANAFEAGEVDADLGVGAFENAIGAANVRNDRTMQLRAIERETAVVNEGPDQTTVGELRMSFTWTAFARQVNETLVVDDAFTTPEGTWLSGLSARQTLVVEPPPGYAVTTAPIGVDDGTLRWEGPQRFEPGYFEIVYQPGAGIDDTDLSTLLLAGAVGLSVLALALGTYLLFRRRRGDVSPSEAPTPTDGDDGVSTDGHVGDTDGEVDAEEPEPVEEVSMELLSDEERIERLLERNGGRMKQATIVKETDWSNAKVSQLLSSMAEADRIDKLRIGRENLISLPGVDIKEHDDQ